MSLVCFCVFGLRALSGKIAFRKFAILRKSHANFTNFFVIFFFEPFFGLEYVFATHRTVHTSHKEVERTG